MLGGGVNLREEQIDTPLILKNRKTDTELGRRGGVFFSNWEVFTPPGGGGCINITEAHAWTYFEFN